MPIMGMSKKSSPRRVRPAGLADALLPPVEVQVLVVPPPNPLVSESSVLKLPVSTLMFVNPTLIPVAVPLNSLVAVIPLTVTAIGPASAL